MALQSSRDELLAAWRALTGDPEGDGWRTIPVAGGGPCRLLAGRRFPENEEALIVGFSFIRIPREDQLPQGQGFLVSKADIGGERPDTVWIALCRQNAGSLDFFTMMADDIVSTLQELMGTDGDRLFNIFLARIRAWQDFMRKGGDGVLGPEAEVGLFGELEVLCDLISAGMRASDAVDAWKGPFDGLQDFEIGNGAIEVKSTVSSSGFLAQVASLDQLDDTLVQQLYLAGIRLALTPLGKTLTELVGEMRLQLFGESEARVVFDSCLLHAGFLNSVSKRYIRRFSRVGTTIFQVSDDFPRLTRMNVAGAIVRARYEIDLDLVPAGEVGIEYVLAQLGAFQ